MEIPGFYFCTCPDALLSKQHLESFVESFDNTWHGDNAKRHVFWPDELGSDPFWNALTLQNLSATPKIIIVRAAHTILAADWKKISSALATPRTAIFPVFFLECAWEKGQAKIPAHIAKLKCFEFAKKKNWTYDNIGINERTISQYIGQEARKFNLQLDKNTLYTLCETAIPDAQFIQTLLSQLSLFAEDGKITPEIISQITAYAPEMVIFDLIKDMENCNFQKIWRRLSLENDNGESFLFPLMALLARDARILWQICAKENPYIHPSAKDFKIRQAKKLGFSGITKIFNIILEADLSVKSGKNDTLQALEKVIIDYSSLFASKPLFASKILINDIIIESEQASRYD